MKAILFTLVLFVAGYSNAQSSSVKTAVIQTSAECGACKTRIEEKLNYTKGIKFAELNLEDKKVTVKYSTKKISLGDIKKLISQTGYAADDVRANAEAVDALPACCKPGGMDKKKKK